MSVTVRKYKRGGWEVDVRGDLPDGRTYRERRKSPVTSKSGSKRWGEARERKLLEEFSKPKTQREEERKEVPTLEEFKARFLDGYARANRHKPSGVASKETILRVHLVPSLGQKRLDEITSEDVQRLKQQLHNKARKTVNNVLTVLSKLMKVAVEWGVIETVPCIIKLLPVALAEADFHDFEEYERLVDAAKRTDPNTHLIVLLGGDAGLRCGEMMALEWTDVDFSARSRIHVRRAEWKGSVTVPKGGRSRRIPMTSRLAATLRAHRNLKGRRVLTRKDGRSLTQKIVQVLVRKAARTANLQNGGVHVLRHTFCSHLAMRGAPTRAIQELAGHKDITTTQRYMHLSPAAVVSAIRLLENRNPVSGFGDIVETGSDEKTKVRN
ncbi:MAG: tyrosine-type recombinase/integrase [Acidobacteriota bacterium]|nr:MAG: tyrosine-type recombinase/integrase [Acidobacteriota bacterium]